MSERSGSVPVRSHSPAPPQLRLRWSDSHRSAGPWGQKGWGPLPSASEGFAHGAKLLTIKPIAGLLKWLAYATEGKKSTQWRLVSEKRKASRLGGGWGSGGHTSQPQDSTFLPCLKRPSAIFQP